VLFLIEYDRPRGSIVQLRKFDDAFPDNAEDVRLKLELDLKRRGVEHEVVLLDAPDEVALRRTHGRYFESVAELVRNSAQIEPLLVWTAKSLHESET
jgi:hypothetical protein